MALSRLSLWTSLLRYEGSNVLEESHELCMFIFNCQLLENCVKCASFFSVKQAWMVQDSPFHNNRFLFIHQHDQYNNKLSHRSQSKRTPLSMAAMFFFSQCKSAKNSGRCLRLAEIVILLHERVAQQCTRRGIASLQSFVPATCPTKFNKLNFVRHVAGTKL